MKTDNIELLEKTAENPAIELDQELGIRELANPLRFVIPSAYACRVIADLRDEPTTLAAAK